MKNRIENKVELGQGLEHILVGPRLSPARQMLLDCFISLNPSAALQQKIKEEIAAGGLEDGPQSALSAGFFSRLEERLDKLEVEHIKQDKYETGSHTAFEGADFLPGALLAWLEGAGLPLRWQKIGLGIQRAILPVQGQERLYLLRARAGFQVPAHGHRGEEWTLLLQGGYTCGGIQYGPGDLHHADSTIVHNFQIDAGEECIALIADAGPLRFESPLLRFLQTFIGL